MQRFIFTDDLEGTNPPGTKTIELLHVIEVTGLNGMPSTINSTKAYGRDGIVVSSLTMDARPFSILFDILGENFEAAAAERRELTAFFGNKKPKKFIYERGDFKVYLKDVYPAGVYETGVNEKRILNGTMQFIATNPYLRRDIAIAPCIFEIPLLEYPEAGVEYPEASVDNPVAGIEYSMAQTEAVVKNYGDETSPALLKFSGPAQNPKVTNTTTGQSIAVSQTLYEGETLEVSTETGKVEIITADKMRHNAFSFMQDGSEFIDLNIGENKIEFSSTGGGVGKLEVGGVEYYAGI